MAAVASLALVVLVACGGNDAGQLENEDVTRVPIMSDAAAQATEEAATGATPGAGDDAAAAAAMTVEVDSFDIYFEPKELTIPADTDVQFILPNKGAAAHNFAIDALDISVDIAPGDTKEIVINAKAGEYEFYCNVPGHKEAGMIGALIVSEDAAAATSAGEATPAADATPMEAASPVAPAESDATPAGAADATPMANAATDAPAAAAEPVEVVSYDIYFEPKEITIPANTAVTVMLPNEGVTAHNFAIDALGISVDIAPGATGEAVINAPAGTYEYYCNVPGHKAAGMVGTLIVTEDAAAPAAAAQDASPAPDAATPAPDAAAPAASDAPAAAVEPVEVVSLDIAFEPKALTIPADTDVTFSLPNEGVTLHNFAIDALDINVDIAPGVTEEAVINAPAGTYEYYCNVPGHKAAGMVGTLTVE